MLVIPSLVRVEQKFCDDKVMDIRTAVIEQMHQTGVLLNPGDRIAIAVGSRGIANIPLIVRSVVEWVKSQKGIPFLIPAMGSHGNGQAEAQKEILYDLGITQEYTGAPIYSSMDVVELPRGDLDNHVYMDRYAFEANGTIVINRIKIHGDFSGETESGLLKMCVIGLGKHKQALEVHKYDISMMRQLLVKTARHLIKHSNIIMGIGLLENAYHETMTVRALRPVQFEEEEIKMLRTYKQIMPKFPTEEFDILIVDEIGKDISGAGMETKIVGRMRSGAKEPESPRIKYIISTDLTAASHGNACGVGIADFITKRLFDKIDLSVTNENIITCRCVDQGKIPVIASDDRQAVEFAIRALGKIATEDIRMVRIKNTLHMSKMLVTPNLLPQIRQCEEVSFIGDHLVEIFRNEERESIPFDEL